MNILYLHAHDLGVSISPYIAGFKTPHLEEFSKDACLFEQAFSIAPTCSPSRAALLTGQYSHQAGMLGLAHRGFEMREKDHHLASLVSARGYRTVLSGVQHEFPFHPEENLPYDRVLGQSRHDAERETKAAYMRRKDATATRDAVEWLQSGEAQAGPFFLSVGIFQPHRPFPDPDEDLIEGAERLIPGFFPDNESVRLDHASFHTGVRIMDNCVGQVLKALRENGLWEKTVIVFTTDHGIPFPMYKSSFTDRGLRVSLLVRYPGMPESAQGKRIPSMVSHLDIVPSLFALIGEEAPAWCEGKSFLPLIDGEVDPLHTVLFAEGNFHAAYEPVRSVRTARYRYIRRFSEFPHWILSNMDESPTKDEWRGTPFHEAGVPEVQLFDCLADPEELRNLADVPEYEGTLAKMDRLLCDWMEQTADPLLMGELQLPEGAVLTPQEAPTPFG